MACKSLPPEKRRHHEAQVVHAAARFEGQQAQALAANAGAGREVAQQPSKIVNAHRQNLRDLYCSGCADRTRHNDCFKERKRVRSPDLEHLNHVKRITEPPLQPRIEHGDAESVRAYARGHSEIARILCAIFITEEDLSHGNPHRFGRQQNLDCFRRGRSHSKVRSQSVRRSQRHHPERDWSSHQALHDFVRGTVASAGNDRVAALAHRLQRQRTRASRRIRVDRTGLDACAAKHAERIVNHGFPFRRALAGSRIVDQRNTTHRPSILKESVGPRSTTMS